MPENWYFYKNVANTRKRFAMPVTHYIAETDGFNEVTTVWIKPSARKAARVFKPCFDAFNEKDAARFDGASADQIKQWIIAQKLKSGC